MRRDPGEPWRDDGSRRVLVIAPVLPYDAIPHAGGVYLQRLHQALMHCGADLAFIVHDTVPNREAREKAGAPQRSLLLGLSQRRSILEKLTMWTAWNLDPWLRKRNPTWPPLPLAAQLVFHPQARAAVRSADLVDVQWPEYARLLPLVKVLNPRARRVATLHDVLSQRWERRLRAAPAEQSRLVVRAARSAKRLERSALRHADSIVVFSEKDRDLLPHQPSTSIEVFAPPLAPGHAPSPRATRDEPTVVFVSMLNRAENDDAAQWLVGVIWPRVLDSVPDARLRIVGMDASEPLLALCAEATRVDVTGFVDDLGAEYSGAWACVIPLRFGAGVKFKTVEALIAGVPTVTTSVGVEGIGGPELFAALTDDPAEMARALVQVLRDQGASEAAARAAQKYVQRRFSVARFRREVERVYGLEAR